ncbi:MAG: hypothetical protein K2P51_01520 [Rhabdochlamydiaceae bacterium]|nr:hypothetical protein [Rhabdochlamydiaceae bacterium]
MTIDAKTAWKTDTTGIWGTDVSYVHAAIACLPVLGIGLGCINIGRDFDERVWSRPETNERLQLLKRQWVHGACALVSSVLTLSYAVYLVAHAILAPAIIGSCAAVVATFVVLTDWPPFSYTICPKQQAEQDRFARDNLQLGYPYRYR